MKKLVFAYGRFNPPTTGHEKLIKKVQQLAGSSDWFIIPSFSHDKGKNPLDYDYKSQLMEDVFPYAKGHIDMGGCCKDPFFAMSYLFQKQKWTDVIFVAGQDRLTQYEKGFAPVEQGGQNGKSTGPTPFAFNSITVVSSGDRDPDAEGATGMSASKLRALAKAGKTTEFMKGIPNTISAAYKVAVMNKILENM
tara:strand:+ start:2389 stop:2967 length:579 start_codon:yes stop_codon:yes gene_type:complete